MEPFTWAIAFLVIAATITALTAPKANKPKAALFSEFDFPQVDEGTPQCVFFGDCWTEDWTVLYVGDYQTEAIPATDADTGGGGKFG